MRAPWVIVGLLLLAAAPLPASGIATDASCSPGGPPVTKTSGAGDPQLPSLVYASLKTGFRGVVIWETEEPEIGRLRFSLNGGATSTRSETVPRTVHVFLLDNLPIGRALCFTPLREDGTPATASPQAFLTANAMNAHDGTGYTMNLLVLLNEQSALGEIEYAMDAFAERLYDSTDGSVRAGRIILLAGDYENHNAGWMPCVTINTVGCRGWYDVIFTNDADPRGAASTYLDGIQSRTQAIYMNWYNQGGLVNTGDDVGSVLMHEMGHYAFGALDLYGGPENCWDPAKDLSIMGASRAATEFDDEINRCPDESSIAVYDPTYPRLRTRFPLVPDRQGIIDEGPHGTGPGYARDTFEVVPQVSELLVVPPLPQVEQDDAGSGGDAGAFPSSAVPIQPGILYEGTMLSPVDGADMYRMDAPAGSTIEVAMYPRAGTCFTIMREDGSSVPGSCSYADGVSARRTISADGAPYYVKFLLGTSPSYRFGYGVDGPAPSLL